MPSITKPHTFTDGTDAVAAEVNADFDTLYSWVNTDAIHKDGFQAFTAVPSGPAQNPTSDNQFARKAYVDPPRFLATATGNLPAAGDPTEVVLDWTVSSNIKEIVANPNVSGSSSKGLKVGRNALYVVGVNARYNATGATGSTRYISLKKNAESDFLVSDRNQKNANAADHVAAITMAGLSTNDTIHVWYAHDHGGFLGINLRLWAVAIPGSY